MTEVTSGLLALGRRSRRFCAAVLLASASVSAQPARPEWGRRDLPYDGTITFVRLRWRTGSFGTLRPQFGGINFWSHEFPRAEQNLMTTLRQVTAIDARHNGSLILTLDDARLFRYPIAMMWEPGYWVMTDREALRLREYLLKGGFVIFNDFELDQWDNFEGQMRRVMPGGRWVRLDPNHPVFGALFKLERIDFPHPPNHHLYGFRPEYFGLFEDNNPDRRLLAIANYNTNLAEYWQMAGTGFFPIDSGNEAFKLGINYFLYGLTH
ncbi:MAG: DUF4159 domain-containing protein [Vicinamibacterales bacterium]